MIPDHICLLSDDPTEHRDAVERFFLEGTAKNEHSATIELASFFQNGALDPYAVLAHLRGLAERAIADGYFGLRVAVEICAGEKLIEYEALLSKLITPARTSIFCKYHRAKFDGALIHDVLRTHPKIVIEGRISTNPYYEPPSLVLAEDAAESKRQRVDWWLETLSQAKVADAERDRMLRQLQTLSRRLFEIQEAERRHLARELHDEVGQLLTGLRLLLKPNENGAGETQNLRMNQARGIVDTLLERIRGLSFDLRPATLDQLGLIPTLVALFERFSEQTGILVSFKHRDFEGRAAPEVETCAFRIVQEGLTNVARHAGVAGANVRLWTTEDTLNLQIEDRGRGFDPEAAMSSARSSGLSGMHERVMLLYGNLTIDSQPGKGTQITAELPMSRPQKKEIS